MMHFCKTLNEDLYTQYSSLLRQLSAFTDYQVVQLLNRTGNAANWTAYPERWGTEIANLKSDISDQVVASNPSAVLASCKISNAIWTIVPPVIFLLGTIGNLLSFIVLCHPSMSQISSYVYLATLAIVDEAVLVFGLLRQWIDRLIGQRIEDMSSTTCKLSQIVGISSSCLSVWLIVALTVERVIVISFPLQANRYASPSRAKVITAALAIIFAVESLHFIETVDLVPPDGAGNSTKTESLKYACEFKKQYRIFERIWTLLDATIYSYVPLLLISIMNVIILIQVYKARRSRRSLFHDQNCSIRRYSLKTTNTVGGCPTGSSNSSYGRNSESSRQLTVMLFVISCCFMITTTPIVIVKVLTRLKDHSDNQENAKFELADTVATMLMYYNHAMNFFLYCATGNKFRQQLKRILCSNRCVRENVANTSCHYNSNYNARLQVRRSTRTSALTSSDEAVELRNLLPIATLNSRAHP